MYKKGLNMEYKIAKQEDFEDLVQLRIRAMKPSLEKIGRFDLNRSIERFRSTFIPEFTTIALNKNKIIGFYMVIEKDEHFFLKHLYIDPEYQNKGFGSILINRVKETAVKNGKNIVLEALKESQSNSFYLSNGFIKTSESEFDNNYYWKG